MVYFMSFSTPKDKTKNKKIVNGGGDAMYGN